MLRARTGYSALVDLILAAFVLGLFHSLVLHAKAKFGLCAVISLTFLFVQLNHLCTRGTENMS